MGRALWIANRRYPCRKTRTLGHRKDACPGRASDMSDNAAFSRLPCFRGGACAAAVTSKKRSNMLLQGLTKLLENCTDLSNDADEDEDEDDDLFHELARLINSRPKNILQELKSLVHRFSTPPVTNTPRSFAKVVRGSVPQKHVATKGYGKGAANQPQQNEWTFVQRKHGKGKGKTMNKEAWSYTNTRSEPGLHYDTSTPRRWAHHDDGECKVIEGDQVKASGVLALLFHLVPFDFFIFLCWFLNFWRMERISCGAGFSRAVFLAPWTAILWLIPLILSLLPSSLLTVGLGIGGVSGFGS